MRTTAIMALVRHLLTHEAAKTPNQGSLIEAAERVSDKLRAHLSKRIGQEGFRTLLARALTLTLPQFPHLSAVQVEADGSLVGLSAAAGISSDGKGDSKTQHDVVEGAVVLVSHLLGLLVIFIGEDLMLRILTTIWPDFDWDDTINGENEKR